MENMTKRLYKVVRVLPDGRMVSAYGHLLGKHQKEYKAGKITRAGGLGVFCFETENDAIGFMAVLILGTPEYKLIEVIPMDKCTKPNARLSLCDETEKDINRLIKNRISIEKFCTDTVHHGNICCKKVLVVG